MFLKPTLRAGLRLGCCAALLATVGCNIIEFSPNDHRVPDEYTNLNQKNLTRLLAKPLPAGDTLSFVFTGDSQRFYDQAEDMVKAINEREKKVQFVLVAGDISDFSLAREMVWVDKQLRKLNVPYLTVVGNHDLNGNGRPTFEHIYGPLDYSFVYGDTKFILIDTNSREYNFDGKIPDMGWLNAQLANTEGARRQMVMMHVPPDNSDFDPNLQQPFAQALARTPNLVAAMNGHNHSFRIGQLYPDGVTYINSDAFSERSYMVIKVFGNKEFSYKRVKF